MNDSVARDGVSRGGGGTTQVLRALGDPVRWSILQQLAQQAELAYRTLEETLPVSKPTISYHTRVLLRAGLIDVCRRGRWALLRAAPRRAVRARRRAGPRRRDAAGRHRIGWRGGRAGRATVVPAHLPTW